MKQKRFVQVLSPMLVTALLSAFCLVTLSTKTFAETLIVEYKSFYSHVSKLNDEQTNALQFAFGFMNINTKQLCIIKAARISTQKQQIDLQVSPEYRFTVPSEKALRLADAQIVIELVEPANICDMSVQLETKPDYLSTQYSKADIQKLFTQYSAFFEKMGGFLSFMMPKVDGINIVFTDKSINESVGDGVQIVNGVLSLRQAQIGHLNSLTLPQKPLRITAVTSD